MDELKDKLKQVQTDVNKQVFIELLAMDKRIKNLEEAIKKIEEDNDNDL